MFDLPLHPKIVHLPMALAVLMPLVSASVLLGWWRGWFDRRVWLLVAGLQAALVVGSFAAMNTGEEDEERVEQVLSSEEPLEAHEEAAELFTWVSTGVLAVMLIGFLIPGDGRRKVFASVATASTLAVLILGIRVGEAGGELVYRHGAAKAHVDGAPTPAAAAEGHEDHDDDDH